MNSRATMQSTMASAEAQKNNSSVAHSASSGSGWDDLKDIGKVILDTATAPLGG